MSEQMELPLPTKFVTLTDMGDGRFFFWDPTAEYGISGWEISSSSEDCVLEVPYYWSEHWHWGDAR